MYFYDQLYLKTTPPRPCIFFLEVFAPFREKKGLSLPLVFQIARLFCMTKYGDGGGEVEDSQDAVTNEVAEDGDPANLPNLNENSVNIYLVVLY